MSGEKDESPASAPAKYSRYRSVRHASVKSPQSEPSPQKQDDDASSLGRTKSMSRYRRSRVGTQTSEPAPPMPPMPPPALGGYSTLQTPGARPTRRVTEPALSSHRQYPTSPNVETIPQLQGRPRETEEERSRRKLRDLREQDVLIEEQRRQADEQLRIAQHRKAQADEQARLMEEETARLLDEQKRKDLERLDAELAAAVPQTPKVTSPREKFGFFSRKRAVTKTSGSGSGSGANSLSRGIESPPPRSVEKAAARPETGLSPPRRLEPVATEPKLEHPKMIEQGGGGIVPQTDAPISASNAGERRVLIRCKQSSINLPFDPETTPTDLIFTAANVMTQDINPSTTVLLESYTPLGLERRVRRYEHIRDIMNSWDRDTQNAVLLQNSDSPQFDRDLDASSVPKEAPEGTTVYMYHSQKPGKWNKRHVTLLSTGQIYMSKKPGAKSSDKDFANLCHLTDFDIYTATPQYTRKVLKPPKKHCYAIKSQQKTAMFLSTENFVHYFSTDDESLAHKWYSAVQQWRSWYLVNRMGEGAKKKPKAAHSNGKSTANKLGRTLKVSVDEDPYTIGSFTPLLDVDRFDHQKPESKDREYESDDGSPPRQVPFHLRNSISLPHVPNRRESKRHPPPVSYRLPPEPEEEFSSSGLLGRTYSQRQRLQKEREQQQELIPSGPFVDGPSLLNSHGGNQRAMSIKSTRTTTMRSQRPDTSAAPSMPKPLLDFTPEFREAPQWDKRGKGHGVKPIEGVPLVDVAKGPNTEALNMGPTQTLFRRDQVPGVRSRTGTVNGRSEGAFIKGGLVSGL
ncbi:uncharacterized protein BP5553_00923 [Venustampulla echinocandica]|uniref:PH domain-containing protein n=1 Tax=Venustampulla echinocandica TaxID=2656787 RepID=A0A370TZJ9_9HELO|nr:uncharacterized protein BP5553_00923 [Venustampulla echinocandica]RDL40944.1 hypothetical protein BP5553_00923 [Venustampulla echinocandica]